MRTPSRTSRAFTLIELVAVIVVLAILAGIAIPQYIDYSSNAKISSTKGVLGGVRSAVANFYANSSVTGTAAYPTLTQLQTVGTVLSEPMPINPFNGASTITSSTWTATCPVAGSYGWDYDPTTGRFWANSSGEGENLF